MIWEIIFSETLIEVDRLDNEKSIPATKISINCYGRNNSDTRNLKRKLKQKKKKSILRSNYMEITKRQETYYIWRTVRVKISAEQELVYLKKLLARAL